MLVGLPLSKPVLLPGDATAVGAEAKPPGVAAGGSAAAGARGGAAGGATLGTATGVGVAAPGVTAGRIPSSANTIATQTGIEEADERFDPAKLSADPHCYECKVRYRDPRPKDLVMFLHAWKYSVSMYICFKKNGWGGWVNGCLCGIFLWHFQVLLSLLKQFIPPTLLWQFLAPFF